MVAFACQLETQGAALQQASIRQTGEKIACRRGCSACCRQAVPISAAEALHLHGVLENLAPPQRARVVRRLREARIRWRRTHGELDSPFHSAELYFSMGVDCPFLENRACSIHSHRPLACREHLVASDPSYCESLHHPFTRMLDKPMSVSQALCRAASRLTQSPEAFFALISFFAWSRINRKDFYQRFTEEEMFRGLVRELGGTLTAVPPDIAA